MRGAYNSRVLSLFRLLADASYKQKLAAVGAVAAYVAAKEAAQDAVPPTGRVRLMPPLWLDRVRACNVASSLPELEQVSRPPLQLGRVDSCR